MSGPTCPTCGGVLDVAGCPRCRDKATTGFRTLGVGRSRPRIDEKARTLTFARQGGDPATAGPHQVRVSAGVLHWPRSCACCCQKPGLTLPLSGDGTPRWDVPYCGRCAGHVRLYAQSLEHERAGEARAKYLPFAVVGATLAMIAVVGILVASAGSAGASVLAATIVGGLTAAALTMMLVAKGVARRAAAAQEADAAFDRSAAGMDDRCACPGPAIEYSGRDAAGHTFLVHNRGYAEAFAASNQGKIVV
jgi:hypothetical protein